MGDHAHDDQLLDRAQLQHIPNSVVSVMGLCEVLVSSCYEARMSAEDEDFEQNRQLCSTLAPPPRPPPLPPCVPPCVLTEVDMTAICAQVHQSTDKRQNRAAAAAAGFGGSAEVQ